MDVQTFSTFFRHVHTGTRRKVRLNAFKTFWVVVNIVNDIVLGSVIFLKGEYGAAVLGELALQDLTDRLFHHMLREEVLRGLLGVEQTDAVAVG